MELKKGEQVYYHPIIGEEHTGEIFECRTDSFESSSGYPVVFLKGKRGYVAVEAISLVPIVGLPNFDLDPGETQ